jgi:hypothetical protein
MIAATRLAQRRAERAEVEEYLGRRTSPGTQAQTQAPGISMARSAGDH